MNRRVITNTVAEKASRGFHGREFILAGNVRTGCIPSRLEDLANLELILAYAATDRCRCPVVVQRHVVVATCCVHNQVLKAFVVVNAFYLIAMQGSCKCHSAERAALVTGSQKKVVANIAAVDCQRIGFCRRGPRIKDGDQRISVAKDVDFVVVAPCLAIQNQRRGKPVGFGTHDAVDA